MNVYILFCGYDIFLQAKFASRLNTLKLVGDELWDLFRSVFSTFWRNAFGNRLVRQIILKYDMKESQICPIWCQSDPIYA